MLEKTIAVAETDRGLERDNNEDRYLVVDHSQKRYDTGRKGMLFAVALICIARSPSWSSITPSWLTSCALGE